MARAINATMMHVIRATQAMKAFLLADISVGRPRDVARDVADYYMSIPESSMAAAGLRRDAADLARVLEFPVAGNARWADAAGLADLDFETYRPGGRGEARQNRAGPISDADVELLAPTGGRTLDEAMRTRATRSGQPYVPLTDAQYRRVVEIADGIEVVSHRGVPHTYGTADGAPALMPVRTRAVDGAWGA